MPSPKDSRGSIWVIALVVAAAAWRFGRTVADPDLWGHVLNGIDQIEAGGYVYTDRYSFLTEGRTWFNHHWLGDIIIGGVYMALGPAGLTAVKAGLALSVVGFLAWWLLRIDLPPIRAALIGLAVVVVITPTFGTFRPQLFTVVLAIALFLIMIGVESGGVRLLWLLPPLFLLWVNIHGGVLAGLTIAGTWSLLHALARGRARLFPLFAFAGSVVAALGNPNGWDHLRFLLETATVARPEIQDWQPIDVTSTAGLVYLTLALVGLSALVVDRKGLRVPTAIPLVGLLLAPLLAWRHLQLFAPGLVILGGDHLDRLSRRLDRESSPATSMGSAVLIATLAAAMVAGVGIGTALPCIRVDARQFEIPQRAVAAWSEVTPTGNAVVPFDWGEYVRWHLGPELQVSSDGRRETIYTEEVHQANLRFVAGVEGWEDLLELAPVEWILVPTASPVVSLVVETGNWTVSYQDAVATILSVDPVAIPGDGAIPTDGHGSCFPA